MTNFASNDCNAIIHACIDDDDDPMDIDFPDYDGKDFPDDDDDDDDESA